MPFSDSLFLFLFNSTYAKGLLYPEGTSYTALTTLAIFAAISIAICANRKMSIPTPNIFR